MKPIEEQLKVIKRGVVDIVTEDDLIKKLKKDKPLTIKLGIDPTAPDIHLGHTVALNKLRQFQDLGHNAVLIIGDYTAMIGDPSGRSSERPALTAEDVKKNVAAYTSQVAKILDLSKLKTVYNSAWFGAMNFDSTIKLISKFTLAQMLEHDTFEKRYKEGTPLGFHELLYPVMQGHDSVEIKSDIELGGTDQRFNVIAGRYLQKESGAEPQVGLFTPILTGLDGKNKMSKSLNNYIGLNFTPEDMFGKVMSITDGLMAQYFELLTDVAVEEIEAMKSAVAAGTNPVDYKKKLAYEIVKKYNSREAAEKGSDFFEKAFSKKEIPYEENTKIWQEVFGNEVSMTAAEFVKKMAGGSGSEARRIIEQGGFYIGEEKITDPKAQVCKPAVSLAYKIGKRNFGLVKAG